MYTFAERSPVRLTSTDLIGASPLVFTLNDGPQTIVLLLRIEGSGSLQYGRWRCFVCDLSFTSHPFFTTLDQGCRTSSFEFCSTDQLDDVGALDSCSSLGSDESLSTEGDRNRSDQGSRRGRREDVSRHSDTIYVTYLNSRSPRRDSYLISSQRHHGRCGRYVTNARVNRGRGGWSE